MGVFSGPDISESGLVLALDATNPRNFNLAEVEVLVVAGGGGGGSHHGGGGGGGGVVYNTNFSVTPGSALTVTVGGGGSGGTYSPNANGGNGGNSVFGSITAVGGGGGGTYPNSGVSGGSGGGSNNWSTSATGGSATSGQGFTGGSNNGQTNYGGGGGGAGGTAKGLSNNSGGDGLPFSISGTQAYYSGGGGAGVYPGYGNDTSYGYGGLGGGGNGGNGPHGSGTVPTAGGTNTGGGGGSVADLYQNGAVGGSGIVIVRYQGPQKAIGGTITSINGYTIHTFTSVGSTTFTPLVATNNSAILGLSDFSNNGNFGTTVNSPTYSSANGGSIMFDGANDYVNIGVGRGVNQFSGDFAISAWVMRLSGGPTYGNIIGDYYTGSVATTNEWQIMMSSAADFNLYRVGTGYVIGNTASGYSISQWINVVVSRIGSTISMYANNNLIASTTNSQIFGTATGNLNIGIDGNNSSEPFSGRISNVMVYKNKGLTAAEVQQNFNANRSRFGI